MDVPGSNNATGIGDRSPFEKSSDESLLASNAINGGHETYPTNAPIPGTNDDDSASDVSMSAETDDEEEDDVQTEQRSDPQPVATDDANQEPTHKRKFSDSAIDHPTESQEEPSEDRKRLKPDTDETAQISKAKDKSLLPAEIWQQIFTFIPPRSLGLCLRVNKTFHAYLAPSPFEPSVTPLARSSVPILKPDTIWQASRRHFWPGMPAPLMGKTELEMWNLACTSKCQFCGKSQPHSTVSADPWHPGPGENGVVPVWPFGLSSCGPCLQSRCSKEVDLLLSPSVPTPLLAALPFVFLTQDLHVVPHGLLSNQPPPGTQITKNFLNVQVEDLKGELTAVKAMGTATAEEWLKGLDSRGKEKKADSGRWERWQVSGGIIRMRSTETSEPAKVASHTNGFLHTLSTNSAPGAVAPNGPTPAFHTPSSAHFPSQLPGQTHFPLPQRQNLPPGVDSPSQHGFPGYPPRFPPPARQERTKEQIAELKAARRLEIERRCMLLDPPLTPGVLAHMTSFQAAIQITQQINDSAWEVLKPRLLSQRDDAEQREKERLAQTRVLQEQMINFQNSSQALQAKNDSKELQMEREWDDIQAPLRARISGFADETIRDGWGGGEKVSKDNSPSFAAQVLIYVRKRFYAEVAKDEAAVRATGQEPEKDPANGPFTRKLTLENMKWVFDTKVKPITEQYRKELFLCNDCDGFKFYGFEGVIQHYAAKHTNALSLGSVVVHWKAEWPEDPPFNPEPSTAKNSYHAAAPNANAQYPPAPAAQPAYGYGGYPPQSAVQAPNPQMYHDNSAPYYGQLQNGEHYPGYQNGHYPPPQSYQDPSQNYQASQYAAPPAVGNAPYNGSVHDYTQQGYSQYPATGQGYYPPQTPAPYQISYPEPATQQPSYGGPQGEQYGYEYSQQQTSHPTPYAPAPQKTEEYKSQLQAIAKYARDVWDSIHNLKEIPGSVKVYTILYHLLKRSRNNFTEAPPLSMIVDGLQNNKDMRKVRNINGLLCKACTLGMAGSSSAFQKKHYSFPQLVSHFYSIHEQGVAQRHHDHVPDWENDMVELPDEARLASIFKEPGKKDQKLKLIAEALPEFSAPQPSKPLGEYEEALQQDPYTLAPSRDNHESYYAIGDNAKPSTTVNGYDDGQYDPHIPNLSKPPPREEPRHRSLKRAEEHYPSAYQDRGYAEPRAQSPHHRVVIREEAPQYVEREPRYQDEEEMERRYRPGPPAQTHEEHRQRGDYVLSNSRAYEANRVARPEGHAREIRYLPADEVAAQQNRIFDVVAQISQQAQQAQQRQPIKSEPVDGSEDGELRLAPFYKPESRRMPPSTEAANAAERFLNNFVPGEAASSIPNASRTEGPVVRYEGNPYDGPQRGYQPELEPQRRMREEYDGAERMIRRPVIPGSNGYVLRESTPPPRQIAYASDKRYTSVAPDQGVARERSPELVDRRFKLNNVVYHDERQSSQGMRRTPSSRYARYESVRLENERSGRSRSPVYVKVGTQPGQYRERSPVPQAVQREPIYRGRTPPPILDESTYERVPRQEYYRVYADEPRPRPQYIETYEYVQVSDPQGDYMIRRPVRREVEPTYAYEAEPYAREPVYETRQDVSRSDPSYYEEYDPRNPGPPPTAAPRAVRYQ